jgi:hypothetical protein
VLAVLTSFLVLRELRNTRSLVGGIFVLVGILAAELLGALTAPESPEPIFEGRIYFESTWRL